MPFTKFVPPKKKPQGCNHPGHNPPGMQVLRPGTHTWKCPACGKEQIVIVPERPRMMSWTDWAHREGRLMEECGVQ